MCNSGGTAINQGVISASAKGLLLFSGLRRHPSPVNRAGRSSLGPTTQSGWDRGSPFTNQSGGTILSEGNYVIVGNLGAGSVVNQGFITGVANGVFMASGGEVTDQSG